MTLPLSDYSTIDGRAQKHPLSTALVGNAGRSYYECQSFSPIKEYNVFDIR